MARMGLENAVGMCVAHTERARSSTAVTTASVKTVLVDRIAASVRDPYVSRRPLEFRVVLAIHFSDFCDLIPCFNGGTCVGLVNSSRCECEPAFVGDQCESGIVENASDIEKSFKNYFSLTVQILVGM